jgi:hypothetical protein
VAGALGFALSLIAVLAIFVAGDPAIRLFGFFGIVRLGLRITAVVACLSIPGFLTSLIALCNEPRRLAIWGVLLGAFGALYVPTLLLAFFRNAR